MAEMHRPSQAVAQTQEIMRGESTLSASLMTFLSSLNVGSILGGAQKQRGTHRRKRGVPRDSSKAVMPKDHCYNCFTILACLFSFSSFLASGIIYMSTFSTALLEWNSLAPATCKARAARPRALSARTPHVKLALACAPLHAYPARAPSTRVLVHLQPHALTRTPCALLHTLTPRCTRCTRCTRAPRAPRCAADQWGGAGDKGGWDAGFRGEQLGRHVRPRQLLLARRGQPGRLQRPG
eukprot:1704244-Prymnesium_polylepis.1